MKIGVLLSGCGVYDGSEIQEAVLTLLAIEESGNEVVCISVDKEQHHVINHLKETETTEKRNMLVESARIARGEISDINKIQPSDIDMLVIPGGFGNAKNLTDWAFNGPEGKILDEVKLLIVNLINVGKPIVALCVSPVVVAKALEDASIAACLTMGSNQAKSPYNIDDFAAGLEQVGATTTMKLNNEINVDTEHKIVSAPCYMMDTNLPTLRKNISDAINAGLNLV